MLPILSQAAKNGNDNGLQVLIQAGVLLDAKDNEGKTALLLVSAKFKKQINMHSS